MKTVTLGDVATVRSSLVDPKERRFANMPHIAPDSLERNTGQILSYRTVAEDGVTSGKYLFQSGDLLYSKIRPNLNKVAIAQFSGLCSADMYAIRTADDVLSTEYLAHLLRSDVFLEYAAAMSNRANIPKLNRQQLLGFTLNLPTLCQQRRIAAILDHADALRANRRQSLAHLDALTQSIFTDMFGKNLPSKDRVPLNGLASLITKGTTPTSVGLEFATEGVPFLRAQNLQRGTVEFGTGDLYISAQSHSVLRRSTIRPLDVLISIAGTIGRTAIVPADARESNCNQAVAIIRLADPSIGPWLRTWLSSADARHQISSSAVTATISNLSLGQIGKLQVPLVPSTTMREFGERTLIVQTQESRFSHSARLLDGLFESVQFRAFRGEL